MARYQEGKGYKQQSADYINSFTRDQFGAQKQMQGKRRAGEKLKNNLTYSGRDIRKNDDSQYFDPKGNLKDITDKNNPFNNTNENGDIVYRGDAYGRGSQAGRDIVTSGDLLALKRVGENSKQKIIDFTENTNSKITGNAQKLLGRWKAAIIEAERENDGSNNPGPPGTAPGISDIDTGIATDNKLDDGSALAAGINSSAIANNIEQGDVTATFGDNAINLGDIGNKSTIYNQSTSGDGTGGYESFLPNAAMYVSQGEDFFNENSGMKYATGAVLLGEELRKNDRPVNFENAYKDSDRMTNMFFDAGASDLAQMYGTPINYQVTDFVMPDDLEDTVARSKRNSEYLQGLV